MQEEGVGAGAPCDLNSLQIIHLLQKAWPQSVLKLYQPPNACLDSASWKVMTRFLTRGLFGLFKAFPRRRAGIAGLGHPLASCFSHLMGEDSDV